MSIGPIRARIVASRGFLATKSRGCRISDCTGYSWKPKSRSEGRQDQIVNESNEQQPRRLYVRSLLIFRAMRNDIEKSYNIGCRNLRMKPRGDPPEVL